VVVGESQMAFEKGLYVLGARIVHRNADAIHSPDGTGGAAWVNR
jgi:hypothetical protein